MLIPPNITQKRDFTKKPENKLPEATHMHQTLIINNRLKLELKFSEIP